jgi:hypothetical protein
VLSSRRSRISRLADGKRTRGRGGEWIGGRTSPPFFIEDREEPYRPELALWMEWPSGLIVGNSVVAPEDSRGALGRALREAMQRPLVGRPRRPERIRVADASLAGEVRDVVGETIPVEVGPTPELEAVLAAMVESLCGDGEDEEASYLEGGRIPAAAVEDLFRSVELLYRMAPWKVVSDDQVLRMDIPALCVEGACVSIIGSLGESLGVLIFPSLAGYEAFARAAQAPRPGRRQIDLGTSVLSLIFERGADLPAPMRREVTSHGWPVADANAHPRVAHRDRDATCRPLVERDVRIASACALALTSFFVQNREAFESNEFEPVCASYTDENDLTVRFTAPYEAFPRFDVSEPPPREDVAAGPPARPRIGRNDPCPCGSGRKYKKCHLAAHQARGSAAAGPSPSHDLDERLVLALTRFASSELGSEWQRSVDDFVDARGAAQLSIPWSVYGYRVRGRTVVDRYLEARGPRLAPAERSWLEAQRAAWLSVWEVIDVEPGASVTLRDLLSHEVRRVREESGSRTLVVRDAVLARVVDHAGESLLCGMHPRGLPPPDAARLVRAVRRRLRCREAVPVERLRDEALARDLIRRWEAAVAKLDRRPTLPSQLQNTDGEAFLLTTDHFELAPGARSEVASRLAALEGVRPPEPDEDDPVYDFLRPGNRVHASWENNVIGQARLSDASLRLETNSRERADALRRRVEEACGDLLRHRAREHSDPLSPAVRASAPELPTEPPPPEVARLLLEFKERHYATWPDEPLPALSGKTPRQAVRTAQGRDAVDVLLKEIENHERRWEGAGAFDFSRLRRELGLE